MQNLEHAVPLVAGKQTVARVYLEASGVKRTLRVRGEIAVARGLNAPTAYVPSISDVALKEPGPDLLAQRADAELSLNFLLPQEFVSKADHVIASVKRLSAPN